MIAYAAYDVKPEPGARTAATIPAWDAWLHPAHLQGQIVTEEPPVLLTGNGVSYEMALTAVFRAMGEEIPEEFAVVYQY